MTQKSCLNSTSVAGGGVGRRAGVVTLVRFSSLGLNALVGVLLARALAVDERGLFALAVTAASVAALVLTLGLDTATLRAAGGRGNPVAVRAAYRRSAIAALAACAAASLILFLPEGALMGLARPEALLAVAVFPVIALHQLLGNCVLGARRMTVWAAGVSCNVVVYGLVCLGLTLAGHASVSSFTFALGVGYLAGLAPLLLVTVPVLASRPDEEERRRLRTASRAAAVPTMAQIALLRLQVPVLLALAGPTAVGYLSIAIPIAELLLVVPVAISSVVLPLYHAQTGTEHDVGRHATASFGVTALGAIILVVLAPVAVPWLYGSAYAPAVALIQILAPAVPVFAFARVLQSSMYANDRFGPVTKASLAALTVTLLVQLVFSPGWGALGAAVAIALGYLTFAAMLWFARGRSST